MKSHHQNIISGFKLSLDFIIKPSFTYLNEVGKTSLTRFEPKTSTWNPESYTTTASIGYNQPILHMLKRSKLSSDGNWKQKHFRAFIYKKKLTITEGQEEEKLSSKIIKSFRDQILSEQWKLSILTRPNECSLSTTKLNKWVMPLN